MPLQYDEIEEVMVLIRNALLDAGVVKVQEAAVQIPLPIEPTIEPPPDLGDEDQ